MRKNEMTFEADVEINRLHRDERGRFTNEPEEITVEVTAEILEMPYKARIASDPDDSYPGSRGEISITSVVNVENNEDVSHLVDIDSLNDKALEQLEDADEVARDQKADYDYDSWRDRQMEKEERDYDD